MAARNFVASWPIRHENCLENTRNFSFRIFWKRWSTVALDIKWNQNRFEFAFGFAFSQEIWGQLCILSKGPSINNVGPFFKFYDPPHCPCRFSLPLEMSFLKSFSPPCKNLHVCCISCTYFQWIWQKKLSQFFQLKYGSNRKNDSTFGILKCQVSSEFKAFCTFVGFRSIMGWSKTTSALLKTSTYFQRLSLAWGGPPSLSLWGDVVYGWPLK